MGLPGVDFPGVGVGLVVKRGRFILLYRRLKAPEAGHWSIPGGKIDHMEPAELAARRETAEETGLIIGRINSLCVTEQIIEEDGQHWISHIYVTDDFEGEPSVMEPEKLPEFGWFDIDDLPSPLSRFAAAAVSHL